MSQEELSGSRASDLAYSHWHRTASIRRYVNSADADTLTMINIDALMRCERWVEACPKPCYRPLVIVETAFDYNQQAKPGHATRALALAAGCHGLVVLCRTTVGGDDIERFRVRSVAPEKTDWEILTPQEYANRLVELRGRATHDEDCPHANRPSRSTRAVQL